MAAILNPETCAALAAARAMCAAMDSLMVASEAAADYLLDHHESDVWDDLPHDMARTAALEHIESLFTAANDLGAAHGFAVVFNRLTPAYELREITGKDSK